MVEILVIQLPWKVSGGWVHTEDLNLQKMTLVFESNLAKQCFKLFFFKKKSSLCVT